MRVGRCLTRGANRSWEMGFKMLKPIVKQLLSMRKGKKMEIDGCSAPYSEKSDDKALQRQ
jgi:hypothetical protein